MKATLRGIMTSPKSPTEKPRTQVMQLQIEMDQVGDPQYRERIAEFVKEFLEGLHTREV